MMKILMLLFCCLMSRGLVASPKYNQQHKGINTDTVNLYEDAGTSIILNNGLVTATITKLNAHITSYRYKGFEVLKDGYYSMDGGKAYSQPDHCQVSVKTRTKDLVDVAFLSTWQPGLRQQALDIEAHYVIERGTAGIYCYAILRHPAAYPKSGFGEWRYVWKIPHDVFDHIMVDSLRNMEMPTSADLAAAQRTSIPESVKLTTGVKAGTYECKYGYSVEYYEVGTYGHASNKNKIGAWMVLGGYDFFNDGPTQADLNAADGGILVHFGRDHYAGSGTSLEAGEEWSKAFGPFFLYMNSAEEGSAAMWTDAKRRVVEEKAKWPYSWLTMGSEYPNKQERGSARGKFMIKDPFKPALNSGNAWIGLTEPGVDWERDSKHYQYWSKANNDGEFTITGIRPGTYTLHAFVNGAVGEYTKENIGVTKSKIAEIGNCEWNIPRNNGKLLWEMGIPDRSAQEFKFGKEYWNSFMWETYSPALPNPVNYTVGKSDWHTDWNYVQSAYWKDGSFSQWPWKINFTIDKLAASGVATLTFAFASADRARLQTFVNDETTPFDIFVPVLNVGGNALVRQGIHAKYSTYILHIPVSKLRLGNNSITLLSNRGINRTDHIMYDYLSLEVPE